MQALSAAAKREEHVCIIGAGKSGLIACKSLTQRGVAFDCFEEGSQVRSGIVHASFLELTLPAPLLATDGPPVAALGVALLRVL